jgi:uncharacterized protein with FMN-binding domain
MRRSPIVLTATAAGTAGILAFHAHAPAVQSATAATPTASPRWASSSTAASSGSGSGSSASSHAASGTATGEGVATPYGDSQVRVTVENGKIVRIEALQLPGDDPRSVEIASYSEPILQQEALTEQSAAVDAVSGATYTSASYTQSLQSALDKLGFKAADGLRATLQVP